MILYSRRPQRLARQIVSDVFVALWLVASGVAGRIVHATVWGLAEPARQTAQLTRDLRGQVAETAEQAGGIPLVGDALYDMFDGLTGSLDSIVSSAQDQAAGWEHVALVLGWLTFLLPAAAVLAVWLPTRLRFVRRAHATRALLATDSGEDLLALRALATQPLPELQRITSDPMAAWRAGDQTVITVLAGLELADAGVSRAKAG